MPNRTFVGSLAAQCPSSATSAVDDARDTRAQQQRQQEQQHGSAPLRPPALSELATSAAQSSFLSPSRTVPSDAMALSFPSSPPLHLCLLLRPHHQYCRSARRLPRLRPSISSSPSSVSASQPHPTLALRSLLLPMVRTELKAELKHEMTQKTVKREQRMKRQRQSEERKVKQEEVEREEIDEDVTMITYKKQPREEVSVLSDDDGDDDSVASAAAASQSSPPAVDGAQLLKSEERMQTVVKSGKEEKEDTADEASPSDRSALPLAVRQVQRMVDSRVVDSDQREDGVDGAGSERRETGHGRNVV